MKTFASHRRQEPDRIVTIPGENAAESLPAPPAGRMPPRWAKVAISVAAVLHLLAVILPPFQFQTYTPGGPATLATMAYGFLQPYSDLMYLNHGYAFFAPDPGPSHLVAYRAEFDDGRPAVEGTFPDPQVDVPRLYYHRRFMLSEYLHGDYYAPTGPPPTAGAAYEGWNNRRANYVEKWAAYERRLATKLGADRVTITRLEHRQPDWYESQVLHMRLNDPSLYVTFGRDEVVPDEQTPMPSPAAAPQPTPPGEPIVPSVMSGPGASGPTAAPAAARPAVDQVPREVPR